MHITRRFIVAQLLTLPFVALARPILARAQVDQDWLRMWKAAQKQRPAALSSAARIAAADEPGTPLVVHGRVLGADGRSPAAGVIVFAYQTGNDGIYAPANQPPHWRLQGWARTSADGRFEFTTIRPAPYPGRQIPAHIHFSVETVTAGRQWTSDVRFDDDPLITADERAQSRAAGEFGPVRTVDVRDGVQHVMFTIKLKPRADF